MKLRYIGGHTKLSGCNTEGKFEFVKITVVLYVHTCRSALKVAPSLCKVYKVR